MLMLQPVGLMYAGALHMGLLPLVPMLLLPFILVFFVIVFPIWGAGLAILGLMFLIVRGIEPLLATIGVKPATPPSAAVHRWLHWVLTFGGFTEKMTNKAKSQPAR